jgi:hypothetical protein
LYLPQGVVGLINKIKAKKAFKNVTSQTEQV